MKTTTTTTETVTRTNRRSTKEITSYIETADRLSALAIELKELQRLEETLRPVVIEQVGDRREVLVNGKIRIVERGQKTGTKIQDDAALLDFAKAHGIKISTRAPEFVAPATARAERLANRIPDELVTITTETIVSVH
jgi:deoxyhypusine synthase